MMKTKIFYVSDYTYKDSDFGYSRSSAWFQHKVLHHKRFHYKYNRSMGGVETYAFSTDSDDRDRITFSTFGEFADHVKKWFGC